MAARRAGGVVVKFDQQSFGATMRILKATDKAIYDNLRKTIRKHATEIKKAQAEAVLGLDSAAQGRRRLAITGGVATSASVNRAADTAERKHRGLRRRTASALRIEYRERATARRPFLGVRIRMSMSAMPEDQRRLPKHLNYGRWRHPVFGNGGFDDAWVTQTAGPIGWFDGTFAKRRAAAATAIGKAIDAAFAQARR